MQVAIELNADSLTAPMESSEEIGSHEIYTGSFRGNRGIFLNNDLSRNDEPAEARLNAQRYKSMNRERRQGRACRRVNEAKGRLSVGPVRTIVSIVSAENTTRALEDFTFH